MQRFFSLFLMAVISVEWRKTYKLEFFSTQVLYYQ